MKAATDGELDVAQLVGHSVAIVRVCVVEQIFARPEEPAEGDDGEVDDDDWGGDEACRDDGPSEKE